ncbi:hypothetical protein PENSPDRAFT_175356 [Peniophora sp. CONT]|nr:hypothetical protein PENSPDRAFT_175356 [Peniophora sp. CONT]
METSLVPQSYSNKPSLPDDIINELFDIAADLDPAGQPESASNRRKLGWINLTHVCRRWREVGLDRSTLWANVVTTFPRALDVMLARAKSVPLTLDIYDIAFMRGLLLSPTYLASILFLVSRARHIKDEDHWDSGCRPVNAVTNSRRHRKDPSTVNRRNWAHILRGQTLPTLEYLELIDGSWYNDRRPIVVETPFTAPNLHTCKLGRFIPFRAPSLSSLWLNDTRLAWTHHLDILDACPMLVDVTILGGLWSDIGEQNLDYFEHSESWMEESELEDALAALCDVPNSRPVVALDCLQTMTLDHCGCEAHLLLQHLSIPAHATVEVGAFDEIILFRRFISQLQPRLCRPEMTVLQLSSRSSSEFFDRPFASVSFAGSIVNWEWPSVKSTDVTIKLNFSVSPDHHRKSGFMPSLLSSLPSATAAHIRTLSFGGEYFNDVEYDLSPEDVGRWITLLTNFSGVTTLYLQSNVYSVLSSYLNEQTATSETLLPNLHTVVLYGDPDGDPVFCTWWADIESWLLMRKTTGSPVMRVVLTGILCHLVDQDIILPGGRYRMEKLGFEGIMGLVDEVVDERIVADGKGCSCASRC